MPAQNTRHTIIADLVSSRTGGPCLEQPAYNWPAKDKYIELKQFEMEVTFSLLNTMMLATEKDY